MAFLNVTEIIELCDAIIQATDTAANRGALFQSVDLGFRALLPDGGAGAKARLMAEISFMNEWERITSGEIPLQIFLQNAAALASGRTASEKVIRRMLDKVNRQSSGAPVLDVEQMPEVKELIIHTDDTVTYIYMKAAFEAASSVFKLRIPAFEAGVPRLNFNGQPLKFLGTGWLLTDSLVMTNHHVINARKDGEPPAEPADFQLQGMGTSIITDFDIEEAEEFPPVKVEALEAWDAALDYAIIRIPPTGRKPLRRTRSILQFNNDPIPVNIIQHPGGRAKRYGIRNNLVCASTPQELRYFTDTETGSSGSPVLDDKWEVVALHRAAKYVENVMFQGKSTAYVNVGTHLKLIMDDIGNRYPALAQEIA